MKKFLSILSVVILLILGGACSAEREISYSATLIDKAEQYATETFLTENATVEYANGRLPQEKCVVIDTREAFENAFVSFPETVNFEQDILVVYFFTDIYYGLGCTLQSVDVENGVLEIELLHEMITRGWAGSASQPTQRCLVVKLTDCEYESVNVTMEYQTATLWDNILSIWDQLVGV